jgi:NAD-dependent deacetylase
MTGKDSSGIRGAIEILSEAETVLVLTGAGMSAESGVPTFRGLGGLWKRFRPEELATPEAFARDPRLCWEWYGWRRDLVARCRPNPGHLALAVWILGRDGVTLVTQNVDGLHEEAAQTASAGGDSSRAMPIRLHGSIFRARCTNCRYAAEHRIAIDATSLDQLPHCPACRALLRPDVVWFGEMLPELELTLASRAAEQAQACLVIGTQGTVQPAAGLATRTRQRPGARLIVVDPGETAFDSIADVRIRAGAAEAIPKIVASR